MYGSEVIKPPKAAIKKEIIPITELINTSFRDSLKINANKTTTELTVKSDTSCKTLVRKFVKNNDVISVKTVITANAILIFLTVRLSSFVLFLVDFFIHKPYFPTCVLNANKDESKVDIKAANNATDTKGKNHSGDDVFNIS